MSNGSPGTESTDDCAIDVEQARRLFHEAEALSDAEGGQTWGRKLYGPYMFVDPASRQIVANQPDREGHLTEHAGLYLGALPAEQGVANTAIDWAGEKWTMVMWPLHRDRYRHTRLLTHEMFHRIQDEIGLPARPCDNGHLDSRDGRIWLRLEWRALSEALIRPGAERRRAIEDALVFRRYRQSLFPEKGDDECALEMHEGMAEYTGYIACGLPAHVLPDRAALALDAYDHQEAYVLNFAYASGPAYGLLLDEAGVNWRQGVSPETDLSVLLADAYELRLPADLASEASARASRYDGQEIITEETAREAARAARLAGYKARFVDGPTLLLPNTGATRWTYDPRLVHAFGDNGKVYEVIRVSDDWGLLEVAAGGAWLTFREDGMLELIVVPGPTDAASRPLSGDGWTLTLDDGWTLKPGPREGDLIVVTNGE